MDVIGIGSIADLAKTIINKFFPNKIDESEKAKIQIQLQEMLAIREKTLMEVQKEIIVSEMNQSDDYTKRARPTVVYAGLFFIFLVHVFFPMITFLAKKELPELALPESFWWAWSSVVGIWAIGRSAEKMKIKSDIVRKINGSR